MQVDFFISSFQNDKILSVSSIQKEPEMRGSDHFPVQIVIQLEEAPKLTKRMIVNCKQLDLITERTQKFLRSKQHNAEEIKERLLAIQNKITTKQHNPKQVKKILNDMISSITNKELAILKHEKEKENDANLDAKADEIQRKRVA